MCESECSNIRCCSSTQTIYDPSRWPPPDRSRQVSDESTASDFSARPARFFRRKRKLMTSIYVDSRLRTQGTDSSFSFDIGESVHIQSGAKLAVYKVRIADAFLSTDRGTRWPAPCTTPSCLSAHTRGRGLRLDQLQLRRGHAHSRNK